MISLKKIFSALGLFKRAFWGYRSELILMTGLGLAGGLLGGIGIGAIIPLLSLISGWGGEKDQITMLIEKAFGLFNIPFALPALLTIIILLFTSKAVVSYFVNLLNHRVSFHYENRERSEIFKKIMEANWPFLSKQKIGFNSTVVMSDVYISSGILTALSSILITLTSLLMYLSIAITISMPVTLTTIGFGVAIFFSFKPLFYKIRKLSEKFSIESKEAAHHINEHEIGAKTIKAMGMEEEVIAKAKRYFDEFEKNRISLIKFNSLPSVFTEPIAIIFITAVFVFSYPQAGFSIASFAAVIYLIQRIFGFIQNIQGKLNNINESLPYLKLILEYKEKLGKHREENVGTREFGLENSLELKNIGFGYDDKAVLSSVNFSIKKGELVGLIGPSGAGKTTIVDLILRLFEPDSGEITLDGKNIGEIDLKNWRKNVIYVSQDIFLLNDTIENNIKFYNHRISENDIIKAAKMANIYDFIAGLPHKFHALVGERGVRLSGGQRQRIILARALAQKPQILILDEATSALDNESEALIQKAIENFKGRITILAIAHRISTVMNSDRLLVLENGKITEEGAPSKLLKEKDSYFYKMNNDF